MSGRDRSSALSTHKRYRSGHLTANATAQQRMFCGALHYFRCKRSELAADIPEAAYVGLPLLGEFERRRNMADEYAGCH